MANPSTQGTGEYKFRCAEMGQTSCNWEATGTSEDDVMRQAEQHGRERHNLKEFTPEMKEKARRLIHRIKAA